MGPMRAKDAGSASVLRGRARLSLLAERAWGSGAILKSPVGREPLLRESLADDPRAVADPTAASGQTSYHQPQTDLFGRHAVARPVAVPVADAFLEPPPLRARRIELLQALNEGEVRGCARCGLAARRTQTVFGEGDPEARLMFIGEGPGETEDATGRPFVGRAGELLDRMIAGMGLRREDVYIANVVKCRPPDNRVPTAQEVATCTPYLHKQIEWIRPQVIVTLGLPATRHLLKTTASMGALRGRWSHWRGIKLMPTYHPAYLLRSYTPQNRRIVWEDLQKVMAELGLSRRNAGSPAP